MSDEERVFDVVGLYKQVSEHIKAAMPIPGAELDYQIEWYVNGASMDEEGEEMMKENRPPHGAVLSAAYEPLSDSMGPNREISRPKQKEDWETHE
jgi:hypothetical protein